MVEKVFFVGFFWFGAVRGTSSSFVALSAGDAMGGGGFAWVALLL
jgi:hypothetical protein